MPNDQLTVTGVEKAQRWDGRVGIAGLIIHRAKVTSDPSVAEDGRGKFGGPTGKCEPRPLEGAG